MHRIFMRELCWLGLCLMNALTSGGKNTTVCYYAQHIYAGTVLTWDVSYHNILTATRARRLHTITCCYALHIKQLREDCLDLGFVITHRHQQEHQSCINMVLYALHSYVWFLLWTAPTLQKRRYILRRLCVAVYLARSFAFRRPHTQPIVSPYRMLSSVNK